MSKTAWFNYKYICIYIYTTVDNHLFSYIRSVRPSATINDQNATLHWYYYDLRNRTTLLWHSHCLYFVSAFRCIYSSIPWQARMIWTHLFLNTNPSFYISKRTMIKFKVESQVFQINCSLITKWSMENIEGYIWLLYLDQSDIKITRVSIFVEWIFCHC